jgi:uncharacterized protein (TIGR03435 family)
MISVVPGFVGRKGILSLLVIASLIFVVKPTANAQTSADQTTAATQANRPSDGLPRFEVATIKPINPEGMHMMGVNVYPGGRTVINTFSLKSLICTAFDLSYWQVSGGDSWVEKDLYDVQAKPPETSQSSTVSVRHTLFGIEDEHLRQMLQALLIDRFQLKFHRETKTGDVDLLEKSGKPLKLIATKVTSSQYPSGEFGGRDGKGMSLHDTSMPELAKFLSSFVVHRPVLNKTGLDGAFNFESKDILTNADFQNNNDFSSFYLRAIKEMGLRLQPSKGPVETLVIDHAEKPSPN